ncbi:MAG: formate--tetrahydrofolate ligase [Alphaproteobacteria bacterium]|nr:formate--tetrahydrofolate ligase [Alphaproteobacteria bacterium]
MDDNAIAAAAKPRPITEVGALLGLAGDDLHPYGHHVAKVDRSVLDRPSRNGRLVLVSAITPTPAGEGKTTTTIGLGMGMNRIGQSTCLALREPSLGPCMGMKGGATGGGYSQILPADEINLHFTGDFHAITSAHNLLAAVIDNHLHFDSDLRLDPRRVAWPRVLDMNDRSLRSVLVGLGGTANGVPREASFDITAASEVMAMLCLASDPDDLRARLERVIVGFDHDRKPVRAGQTGAVGAMMALLHKASLPNLVQTLEGTPALVHGGPFANIAHGCNSVVATRMALHLADWCITEAGFGFDLGAEKFFDIKCRLAGLNPSAVVLVATIRALKMHGGVELDALSQPDAAAVERGLGNLEKHLESVLAFGARPIVALNRFAADTDAEIAVVRAACDRLGVPFEESDHHARGGAGAEALARRVVEVGTPEAKPFTPLYALSDKVPDKIRKVAQKMYGARDIELTSEARNSLRRIAKLGYADLPICIAKTQSSLSDDPKLRGRPRDFTVTVRDVKLNAGAGFLVVLTGNILRMPGLPKVPQAEHMDVVDGRIVGVR